MNVKDNTVYTTVCHNKKHNIFQDFFFTMELYGI